MRDSSRWTFGSRAYTAGSAAMSPSMWANRKNPRTPCIIVTTEESISPALAEVADVQLDVSPLDPDQRVQTVGLAPGEPARAAGSAYRTWVRPDTGPGRRPRPAAPVDIVVGWNGRTALGMDTVITSGGDRHAALTSPTATAARPLERIEARPWRQGLVTVR